MKSMLNILHLEDDPNDAALVQSALEAGDIACTITRVDNRDDFVAAIGRGSIDLVLSDFKLPAFDGSSAMKIARDGHPDMPFILVSGTLGEERAIDSIISGATDYVLKNNLVRLVPAVRRAIQEVSERSDLRRLELQFVEAQKMEVIGHLASGVAHDFNNVLGVIIGYSDLLMPELAAGSLSHKCAEEIRQAADRAVALTRQLLLFSRKQSVQPVVLDLGDVVGGMDKMLQRLIDENIELTIIHGQEGGRIKADSGLISQLLMNLVVNARDAMPNGGRLKIETANITLDEKDAHSRVDAAAGDYVMLAVSDTGIGMTDEVKARLFEAFFTTKPKGKGTGLGLVTCRTIVKQCGGHIGLTSEVGKGTTFKVYFPRVEEPADALPKAANEKPFARGTETLLLVEDEPSVRHLGCKILEAQGYNVLRANNGQEGLRVARECKGQPIRLVITDVIMPQMSGKVMAEWLKASYPDLKILFTSGYTDDAIAQHGVFEAGVAFLAKPYSPATLVRKVREMLDNETDTSLLRKQKMAINQS
jgi:signal transduction histidine kinase